MINSFLQKWNHSENLDNVKIKPLLEVDFIFFFFKPEEGYYY